MRAGKVLPRLHLSILRSQVAEVPKRVLVVDDEPAVTRAWARLLRSGGFEAQELQDSGEALAAARAYQPHAVILDYKMTPFTGIDVARQFAEDATLQSVPILICSGTQEIPLADLPSANIPVVRKPLDAEVLFDWLRERLTQEP